MGIEDTLIFFKNLKDEGFVKPEACIALTHLSDRWGGTKTGDVVLIKKVRKITEKYWDPKLLWIPQKDGFEINYSNGQITKKGPTS